MLSHWKNYSYDLWEFGGNPDIREIWDLGTTKIHFQGIFFLVDASKPELFEEAREELRKILFHPSCKASILGIVFNQKEEFALLDMSDLEAAFWIEELKEECE